MVNISVTLSYADITILAVMCLVFSALVFHTVFHLTSDNKAIKTHDKVLFAVCASVAICLGVIFLACLTNGFTIK